MCSAGACGACTNLCPTLAAPSFGTRTGCACIGDVGGFVEASGTAMLDPTGGTQYAVMAQLPAAATFTSLSAKLMIMQASNPVTLALWSDNGSQTGPGSLLFYAETPQTMDSTARVYTVMGDNRSLSPGTYWVSVHPGFVGTSITASLSSSPCVSTQWINVAPPAMWSFAMNPMICSPVEMYMTVGF
jgi:hypothetical protein